MVVSIMLLPGIDGRASGQPSLSGPQSHLGGGGISQLLSVKIGIFTVKGDRKMLAEAGAGKWELP